MTPFCSQNLWTPKFLRSCRLDLGLDYTITFVHLCGQCIQVIEQELQVKETWWTQ